MNGQQTFSDIEYSMRKRTTKRVAFLDAMDECIVWDEWCALIEPYYFKGKRGRPPMGIEKMLRMYLLQVWFNLPISHIIMWYAPPRREALCIGSNVITSSFRGAGAAC